MTRFASALSTLSDTGAATRETLDAALARLGGAPHLALVFVSHHHADKLEQLAVDLKRGLGDAVLLGCTGESIVGGDREIEEAPAVALWLASLPETSIVPMHLEFEQTAEGPTVLGWPDELPPTWPQTSALVALGEPFSFPADLLLERLNQEQPRVPVFGGMASGGHQPGQNRLLLGNRVLDEGAVAVWIDGAVQVRGLVSQGCRPIGRHFVVTKAERNLIFELSGRPAMEQLHAVYGELTAEDQQLVRGGLHVGRVINEYQDQFARGDFLIRNVIGADTDRGVIAIGDYVRPGQTVQFHLRDAASADDDLRQLAAHLKPEIDPHQFGALLFTCNGRGTRLFDAADHDARALVDSFGALPLAGFFAQGEMGPVGGKNFLHGFTASVALLGPRDK